MRAKLTFMAVLLSSCVGCDQVSKELAVDRLKGAPPLSFLADSVRLTYAENAGAFLGLGADWPELLRWGVFGVLSGLMMLAVAVHLVSRLRGVSSWRDLVPFAAMALIVAGGVGNWIDRIVRGGVVVDFMNLGIGPLRTGIFNVADVQIMLGLAMLLWWRPQLRRDVQTSSVVPLRE